MTAPVTPCPCDIVKIAGERGQWIVLSQWTINWLVVDLETQKRFTTKILENITVVGNISETDRLRLCKIFFEKLTQEADHGR